MTKTILFSPVGGTDPISNERDGALLHISRVYRPDIIYMYMSKEMMDFHNKDNRYLYCLDKLSEKLKHTFDINLIMKEDLIDVQRFDIFYSEFRKHIQMIKKEYPDSKLLLNVSSGTPAMKSALQVLATLAEFEFVPIQVSTPRKKINKHEEDKENYDVEVYWEFNEDNEDGYENRCIESKTPNLMAEIKKEIIEKHVQTYDYVAALNIASAIKLPEDTIALLNAAKCRKELDISGITKHLKGTKYDILPVKAGDQRAIFEYYMCLTIKIKKEEYVDFVRGITPIVADILELIVKNVIKLNLDEYCYEKNKDGIKYKCWNVKKVNANQRLNDIFNEAYKDGIKETAVSYHQLAIIIENMSNDCNLVDDVLMIKKTEEKVRNMAAHEVISVTKKKIEKELNKTPKQILDVLKRLCIRAGIDIRKEYLSTYDDMNALIIQSLKEVN